MCGVFVVGYVFYIVQGRYRTAVAFRFQQSRFDRHIRINTAGQITRTGRVGIHQLNVFSVFWLRLRLRRTTIRTRMGR